MQKIPLNKQYSCIYNRCIFLLIVSLLLMAQYTNENEEYIIGIKSLLGSLIFGFSITHILILKEINKKINKNYHIKKFMEENNDIIIDDGMIYFRIKKDHKKLIWLNKNTFYLVALDSTLCKRKS